MAINAEVNKNGSESSGSMLRRFSRKIQSSGIIIKARKIRYQSRPQSKYSIKKSALKLLKKRAEIAHLVKMGKMEEKQPRR